LAVTVLAVEVVVQRFGVRLPRVVYAALLAVLGTQPMTARAASSRAQASISDRAATG
jgi:hypothetical protein